MKDIIKEKREQIQILEEEIKSLQDSCKHLETFEEKRMWMPSAFSNYKICKYCNAIIANMDMIEENTIFTTSVTGNVIFKMPFESEK